MYNAMCIPKFSCIFQTNVRSSDVINTNSGRCAMCMFSRDLLIEVQEHVLHGTLVYA